jgi:hypothetical protein
MHPRPVPHVCFCTPSPLHNQALSQAEDPCQTLLPFKVRVLWVGSPSLVLVSWLLDGSHHSPLLDCEIATILHESIVTALNFGPGMRLARSESGISFHMAVAQLPPNLSRKFGISG